MDYNYLITLHLFGSIVWMAGVIGHSRLIHDISVGQMKGNDVSALAESAKSTYYKLMIPGMVLALIFGIWMITTSRGLLHFQGGGWLHIKLTLLVLFIAYHHISAAWMKKMIKTPGSINPTRLAYWKVLPIIILAAIVMMAIVKDLGNMVHGLAGLGLFAVVLLAMTAKSTK